MNADDSVRKSAHRTESIEHESATTYVLRAARPACRFVISILRLFWHQLNQEKRLENSMKGDPDAEVRVFTQAVKVSCQERGALLERLCGSDRELRRKVEKLLRAHDRLGNFMEEPPTGKSID